MFSFESIQPAAPAAMVKRKASGRKFVQSFMPAENNFIRALKRFSIPFAID
jgi:hypothetical protein